jgi:hypothetical protein
MIRSDESQRRWPAPWAIALAALGLFWFAWGLRGLPERHLDDPVDFLPFFLAGLAVVAGIGLVAGGVLGRVVAALIAVAGAAPVILIALIMAVWAGTDPHGTSFSLTNDSGFGGFPTWTIITLVLGIVVGYGLVFVRAIRGR